MPRDLSLRLPIGRPIQYQSIRLSVRGLLLFISDLCYSVVHYAVSSADAPNGAAVELSKAILRYRHSKLLPFRSSRSHTQRPQYSLLYYSGRNQTTFLQS